MQKTGLKRVFGENRTSGKGVVFAGIIGGVCLLIWLQFLYFKAHTRSETSRLRPKPPEYTAADRAEMLRKKAQEAAKRQELKEFIEAAQAPRSMQVAGGSSGTAPKPAPAGHPRPNRPVIRPPPVLGAQWGSESNPALRQFSKWTKDYADASPEKRAAMKAEGLSLAEQRREVMANLIANDPAAAIAAAAPAWVAGTVPLEIREMLERRISGIGDLDVYGVTPDPTITTFVARVQRVAHLGLEKFDASVYGRLASVGGQRDISMHGVALDNQAALMDSPIRLIPPGEPLDANKEFTETKHPIDRLLANRDLAPTANYAFAESGNKLFCLHCAGAGGWRSLMNNVAQSEGTAAAPNAAGPIGRTWQTLGTDKKVLIALVDFSDMTGGEVTTAVAETRATDMNNALKAMSYDKFAFGTRTVVPTVLRMPNTAAYYKGLSGYQGTDELAADANASAVAEGYDPAGYDFFVIAFKNMDSWNWSGLGTIGKSGTYPHAVTWINGNSLDARVLVHEIGHNLGMFHANSWEPPTNAVADTDSGTHVEYGFYYDNMGDTWRKTLAEQNFNAHFKQLLGWLPDENVQEVNGNFSGRIYASDQTLLPGRKYAIRIDANRSLGTGGALKSGLDYWIEHRSLFTGDPDISDGALIYLTDDDGSDSTLRLLDMTPATETYDENSYANQKHDQALKNGSSFTDSNNRWTISVTGRGGSGANAFVDIEIIDNNLPKITVHPQSAIVEALKVHSVNVTATGTGLTYQWLKNGANIAGATSSSYTINSFTAAHQGVYSVIVSNTDGNISSALARLHLRVATVDNTPITIDFNGTSRTAAWWGDIEFEEFDSRFEQNESLKYFTDNNSSADGSVLRAYQLQALPYDKDWAVQADVNLPAITLPDGGLAAVGLKLFNQDDPLHRAQVSLARNGISDRNFEAIIDVNRTAINWDQNATTSTHATVRLRWDSGAEKLHYEYDANASADGYTWTPFTSHPLNQGLTDWDMNSTSSFLITLIGESSKASIAKTDNIWLDNFEVAPVASPPSITQQPVDANNVAGATIVSTVKASGTEPLAYQWQKDINGTWTNLTGWSTDSADLYLMNVQPEDSGDYRCIVSNTAGTVTSSTAKVAITLQTKLEDFHHGLGVYLPFNGNANDATGNGNHGTVNGATLTADRNGSANSAYSFDGNDDISVPLSAGLDNFTVSVWFRATADGTAGTREIFHRHKTADRLDSSPSISWKSSGGDNFVTSAVVYSDKTTTEVEDGNNTAKDEWHHAVLVYNQTTHRLFLNGKLVGAKAGNQAWLHNASQNIFHLGTDDGVDFFIGQIDDVRVFNRALSDAEVDRLHALESPAPPAAVAPLITIQPLDINATQGSTVTFVADANGTAPLIFQWDRKETNGTYTPLPDIGGNGASTDKLTLSNVTMADDNRSYRLRVSNSKGTAQSRDALLRVQPPPAIVTHPTSQTVRVDSNATLSVDANGTELEYQWYRNSFAIEGATNATLNLPHVHHDQPSLGSADRKGQFLDGQLDNLRVYSLELFDEEIAFLAGRPKDLIASYPLNGDANDHSGNDLNGTITGATAAADRFGAVNGAFSFSGSNQSIDVADDARFNIGAGDFTISFWLRFSGAEQQSQILGQSDGPGAKNKWYIDYSDLNGTKKLALHINTTANNPVWLAPISRPYDTNWHHVTFVKQGSDYYSYLDGEFASTSTGPATLPDSTGQFRLGTGEGNFFLRGDLDEVLLFHQALDYDLIGELAGYPMLPLFLGAHFPFNGNANDLSGLDNNGTVHGADLALGLHGDANGSFAFDGLNDSITIGDTGFPEGNTPRTVAGWVKLDANSTGDQTILFYGKREPGKGFWLGIDGAGDLEASGFGDANASHAFDANRTVRDGTWHHVAFTLDVNGTARLYVDGVLSGQQSNWAVDTQLSANAGYHVEVSNAAGVSISNPAVIEVTDHPPVITVQPANFNAGPGMDAWFDVNATGAPPLTYQWQREANGTFVNVAGATGTHLQLFDLTGDDNGTFRVLVTNNGGTTASGNATLAVGAGLKAWEFATDGGITGAVAVGSDGTVYFGSQDDKLYALDGASGALKWEFDTGGDVISAPSIGHNGTVYVTSNANKLFALNGQTGVKLWEAGIGTQGITPVIGLDGIVYYYAGTTDKKFRAAHGQTGDVLWEVVNGGSVPHTPVIGANGLLVYATSNGKLMARNRLTGAQQWEIQLGGQVSSAGMAIGGNGAVYFATDENRTYAIDSRTGQTHWTFATEGTLTGAPIIGPDHTIYIGSYAINAQNGTQRWKGHSGTPGTIDNNATVYLAGGGDDQLHAVNTATGAARWKFATTGDVRTPPILGHHGLLYIGSLDERLYAVTTAAHTIPAASPWPMLGRDRQHTHRSSLLDGLIAWYPLDGNAIDASGYDHNGTVNGAIKGSDRFGDANGSMYFDGIDDRISAVNDLLPQGDTPRSVALWVKAGAATDQNRTAVTWGSSVAGNAFGLTHANQTGGTRELWFDGHGDDLNSTRTLTAGWHHLALTYDRTNVVMYLDGQSVQTGAKTLNTAGTLLTLGESFAGAKRWQGNLDDVRVYNRVLEPGEIQQLFGALPAVIIAQPQDAVAAVGANVTFTVDANSTTPLGYQWLRNGVPIADANASSYTINSVPITDNNTTYRVLVTNHGGTISSREAHLRVGYAPAIARQPADANASVGSAALFDVNATGTAPLTYRWQKNNVNIAGATTLSYSLPNVQLADDNTSYRVVVTNDYGTATSAAALLIVTDPPVITRQPTNFNASPGKNAWFDVNATGGQPLQYQWQREVNGTFVNLSSGATSPRLSLSAVTGDDNGTYRVLVTNPDGTAASGNATLAVGEGLVAWEFLTGHHIISTPAIGPDGTLYFGSLDNKVYAVNPDGTKQWEFNTNGDVDSSPAVDDNGTVYVGSRDGKIYALNGQTGVKIWHFDTGIGNGGVGASPALDANGTVYVGGYNKKVYALNALNGSKLWEYETGGGVGSSPALGTDGTVYIGSDDNKVYALDGQTGTKKWEFATGHGVRSSPAVGADGTVYVGSNDDKIYALNGQTGAKIWEFATGDNVESSPALGADGTVYVGSNDNIIYALDGLTGTKKWEFATGYHVRSSPLVDSNGTVYVGSRDNKLYALNGQSGIKKWAFTAGNAANSSPAVSSDGTLYFGSNDKKLYALTSRSTGLANSPWPKFSQNNRNTGQAGWPVILSQPQDAVATVGDDVTFAVNTNSTVPLSYQWLRNGSPIADANASSYTITSVKISDNNSTYRVRISFNGGSISSREAHLRVGEAPGFARQPADANVPVGGIAQFDVNATGTAPLAFQWQKNSVNIPGATSPSYSLPNVQLSDHNTTYRVLVSNEFGNATSTPAILSVGNPPIITQSPVDRNATAGTAVSLDANATGTAPLVWQWQKRDANGTFQNVAGGATRVLNIANLTTLHTGIYRAQVSNAYGNATSATAQLTVFNLPIITRQPLDTNSTIEATVVLDVNATGTAPLSYQWQREVNATYVNLAGATSASLSLANVTAADTGNYRCLVSNWAGTATSASAAVLINEKLPSIASHPASANVLTGANVDFDVNASGVGITYQWQLENNGTFANLAGETTAQLNLPNAQMEHNGTRYRVVVATTGGSVASLPATLTVRLPLVLDEFQHGLVAWYPFNGDATDAAGGDNNGTVTGATLATDRNGTGNRAYSFDGANDRWIELAHAGFPAGNTDRTISAWFKTTWNAVTAKNRIIFANGSATAGNYLGLYITESGKVGFSKWGDLNDSASSYNDGRWHHIAFVLRDSHAYLYVDGTEIANQAYALSTTFGKARIGNRLNDGAETWQGALDEVRIYNRSLGAAEVARLWALELPPLPVITADPVDTIVVASQSGTLDVNATSATAWQWQRDVNGSWTDLPGAVTRTHTLSAFTTAMTGDYRVIVSNAAGNATSAAAAVSLATLPGITRQPADVYAPVGSTASFSVDTNGSLPHSFQWQKNTVNVDGATNRVLTLSAAALLDAGAYRVVVSNAYGNVTSASAQLNVGYAPTITTQPTDANASLGSNVTLSVDVNGTAPITYQWSLNGADLNGSTAASLALNGVTLADSGVYRVAIANAYGSATSAEARVTVGAEPAITLEPVDVNASTGSRVTFSADANGTGPLSFEWQKDGSRIPGAVDKSYVLPSVTADANGSYQLVVTSPFGNATTRPAVLAVGSAPVFTEHPMDVTKLAGNPVSFSGDANGTGPMAWQWLKDGAAVAGATNRVHSIASVTEMHSGSYRLRVSTPFGNATSAAATLHAGTAPAIITEPVDVNATLNGSASISIDVNGTSPLTYEWRKDGVVMAGVNSPTLSFKNVNKTFIGVYRVKVSNVFGSVTSRQAYFMLEGMPVITAQPQDSNTTLGEPVTLSVTAEGNAPLSYQWKLNGVPVEGANNATYAIAAAQHAHSGYYQVEVTNDSGSATSRVAKLVVGEVPQFVIQPPDLNGTAGDSVWMRVRAVGSMPLNYVWTKDGVPLPDSWHFTIVKVFPRFSKNGRNWVQDATGEWCFVTPQGRLVRRGVFTDLNASVWEDPDQLIGMNFLFIRKADATHAGTYRAQVSNQFGSDISREAAFGILAPPKFTQHPVHLGVAPDGNGTFTVEAEGDNVTYQWQKDGINLTGATNKTLTLTGVDETDEGTYRCVAANPIGTDISSEATFTLLAPPEIVLHPTDRNASAQGSAVFNVAATGLGPLTYQWQQNGTNVVGGMQFALTHYHSQYDTPKRKWLRDNSGGLCYVTPEGTLVRHRQPIDFNASVWQNPAQLVGRQYLAFTSVHGTHPGNYHCVVTNPHGNATSNTATLTLISPPLITTEPSDLTVDLNSSATFSFDVIGASLTYQWHKDNAMLAGETNATLVIPAAQATHAGTYHCVISNEFGVATTRPVTLTVNIPPTLVQHPVEQNATAGENVIFSVVAEAGGSTLNYQWQKDGANINGASGFTITEHLAQFDGPQRKWVRDGTGAWCFVLPSGTLVRRGQRLDFNASIWADPTLLMGANYYAITQATSTHAGTYRCRVSNTQGTVYSQGAALNLVAPPVITVQPVDVLTDLNGTAAFTVSASGDALVYQWHFNDSAMAGENNATLTIANVGGANSGRYHCVVSNAQGSITSAEAALNLRIAPVIADHPADVNATGNSNVALSVRAESAGALSYQWQKDGVDLTAPFGLGVEITTHLAQYDSHKRKWLRDASGKLCYLTSGGLLMHNNQPINVGIAYWNQPAQLFGRNFLGLSKVTTGNAGTYRCVVSNAYGNATSNAGTLTVVAPPAITTPPANQTINAGGNATFSVVAAGTGMAYQWRKDGADLAGATTASYTVTNAQFADGGEYRCLVTNAHGATLSDAALLTVMAPPVITSHPADVNATAGNNVLLSVSAEGAGALTYQWQKDGTDVADGYMITQHMAKYDRPTLKWLKDAQGNWCQLRSDGFFFRRGIPVEVGVAAFNNPGLLMGKNFLMLKAVTAGDAGSYRCVVTNSAGSTTSNSATISVP